MSHSPTIASQLARVQCDDLLWIAGRKPGNRYSRAKREVEDREGQGQKETYNHSLITVRSF